MARAKAPQRQGNLVVPCSAGLLIWQWLRWQCSLLLSALPLPGASWLVLVLEDTFPFTSTSSTALPTSLYCSYFLCICSPLTNIIFGPIWSYYSTCLHNDFGNIFSFCLCKNVPDLSNFDCIRNLLCKALIGYPHRISIGFMSELWLVVTCRKPPEKAAALWIYAVGLLTASLTSFLFVFSSILGGDPVLCTLVSVVPYFLNLLMIVFGGTMYIKCRINYCVALYWAILMSEQWDPTDAL